MSYVTIIIEPYYNIDLYYTHGDPVHIKSSVELHSTLVMLEQNGDLVISMITWVGYIMNCDSAL